MEKLRNALPIVRCSEVAEAVHAFDKRYGEMEKVLWHLSSASRVHLLRGERSDVVKALVWKIRSWWGVRGVTIETGRLVAQILAADAWTESMFEATSDLSPDAEVRACNRVFALVSAVVARGARYEFSLASKVLHWLLPWRIPVYDSFARESLGILSWDPEDAYREIVRWEYEVARNLTADGSDWMGYIEPRSPLRAIDKYLWRLGGGDRNRAIIIRDPWRVVSQLGLEPSPTPLTAALGR